MKLITGNGLYVLVRAHHVLSIANYQQKNSEAILKGRSEVKLTNGDIYLCDGPAEALYADMKLEINMGVHK